MSFSDDLTVEVIFFGDGEATGTVKLNKEASAAAQDIKPKL
jgi:pyruvate dehydrogenase phosphatase